MADHRKRIVARQRQYRWLCLLFSIFLPGLGLIAAGQARRGVLWFAFVLSSQCFYFLYAYQLPVFVLWAFTVLFPICFIPMAIDSWRPIARMTLVRWSLVIAMAVVWWGVLPHIRSSWSKAELFIGTGASMRPTLGTYDDSYWLRDRLWRDKTAYINFPPERGDIVAFRSRLQLPGTIFSIKRIAGLPNETIRINPPWLVVNGANVSNPAVFLTMAQMSNGYTGFQRPISNAWYYVLQYGPDDEVKLGSNEYFLLGDNSAEAVDSRYLGPVHRSNIVGKITKIAWPPSRIRDLY